MAIYKVTTGQSIFDIAIQKTGDISQALTIVKNNVGLIGSIDNSNLGGLEIEVDEVDNDFTNNLKLNRQYLNTVDPKIIEGVPFSLGFDFGLDS